MKFLSILTTLLLGFVLIVPEADARGQSRGKQGGGGRSVSRAKVSAPKRSASPPKRSPMTGSKISRPTSRPAPKPTARPASRPSAKPATRPAAKPITRPSVQKPSVQRPSTRPEVKPGANRPNNNRPNLKPGGNKPDNNRPNTKPDTKPNVRPDNRPSIERPKPNKPSTLPGMVTYPNKPHKPNKPGIGGGNNNRPGIGGGGNNNRPEIGGGNNRPGGNNNRPGIGGGNNNNNNRPNLPGLGGGNNNNRPGLGNNNRPNRGNGNGNGNRFDIDNSRDRNKVHIDKVNIDRRNNGLNRPVSLPANRGNWDRNRWGGNKSVWGNRYNIGNDVNVNINNNFRRNYNYSYRPNYWGSRPWWGAGHNHGWHHGHWNYGWNSHYYRRHWYYDDDDDFASGFMWGIGVWSVGNLIYNMGYQTYRNPYPAPPVQYYAPSTPSAPAGDSKSLISYTEPVSVVAAQIPTGDDSTAEIAETKSDEALERSRESFMQGDYLAASKSIDEALAYTPGDVTLHEFRALVFFALGKYSDAAGVLNSALASGPGWSWDTMIGFYNGSETYNEQLRKLEAYVKGAPDKADARFLLGYHYMVCGHMEKSNEQFAKACELQPADTISRQLRDLTKSSIPDGGDSEAEPPVKPAPVPADQLVGTWVCDRGADGKVTFTMTQEGDYTWTFMNNDQPSEMKGTYGLNEKDLLVLTTEDSQLVSAIEMKEGGKLHFMLVGAPDGDPGLKFTKN